MMKIDLGGTWNLKMGDDGKSYEGHLPGCNYLDLMENGKLENPFWGKNEQEETKIAKQDFEYERTFINCHEKLHSGKLN